MAEFVMKDLVRRAGLDQEIYVASAACRRDEIGSDTYLGTREKLDEMGIPYQPRHAVQITKADCASYDLIVGMDGENMRDLNRLADDGQKKKLRLLMEFAGESRDVADPWYTGDFDTTYMDIRKGCRALLKTLRPTP